MIENTLLNKSGVRPAVEHSKMGHSNKQQNNTNNRNVEREDGDVAVKSVYPHPSIYLSK